MNFDNIENLQDNIKIWQVIRNSLKIYDHDDLIFYYPDFNCWYVDKIYILNLIKQDNDELLIKYIKVLGCKIFKF